MAETLGDLIVRITGDTSLLDKAVDSSQKSMERAASAAQSLANSVAGVEGEASKGAKSAAAYAKEMADAAKVSKVLGTQTSGLAAQQALLQKRTEELVAAGLDPASKEARQLGEEYKTLGKEAMRAADRARDLEKVRLSMENLGRVGARLSLFVTAPILAIGAAAVKSSADIEMQVAAFSTLLGSGEKANALLADMKDLAAKTPFMLPDITEAGKLLMGFGVDVEKIMPTIRTLGDISQGSSQRFQQLALAFAQSQAAGRLMGQDLLQMVNAGFNPLLVMAEKTGKSMGQLRQEMGEGKISAAEVADAFASATEEGGKFYKGMENASLTLEGRISTLKDNVAELGRKFADMLLPILKDIVGAISQMVLRFTALDEGTRKTILAVVGIAAAVGPAIVVVTKLVNAVKLLNAAMLGNPYLLAGAALLTLVAGIGAATAATKLAKEANDSYNESLKTTAALSQKNRESSFVWLDAPDRPKLIAETTAKIAALTDKIQKLETAMKVPANKAPTINIVAPGAVDEQKAQLEELRKLKAEGEALLAVLQTPKAFTPEEQRTEQSFKTIEDGFAKVKAAADAAAQAKTSYDATAERGKVVAEEWNRLLTEGYTTEGTALRDVYAKYQAYLGLKLRTRQAEETIAKGIAQTVEEQKAAIAQGKEYDLNLEQRKVVWTEIDKLIAAGYTYEGAGIQMLIGQNKALLGITDARADRETVRAARAKEAIDKEIQKAEAQADIDKLSGVQTDIMAKKREAVLAELTAMALNGYSLEGEAIREIKAEYASVLAYDTKAQTSAAEKIAAYQSANKAIDENIALIDRMAASEEKSLIPFDAAAARRAAVWDQVIALAREGYGVESDLVKQIISDHAAELAAKDEVLVSIENVTEAYREQAGVVDENTDAIQRLHREESSRASEQALALTGEVPLIVEVTDKIQALHRAEASESAAFAQGQKDKAALISQGVQTVAQVAAEIGNIWRQLEDNRISDIREQMDLQEKADREALDALDKRQQAERQAFSDRQRLEQQAFSDQQERDRRAFSEKQRAEQEALDASEQAALRAAGVAEQTRVEELADEIAKTEEEKKLAEAKGSTKKAAQLAETLAELEKEKKREEILEEFRKKREEADKTAAIEAQTFADQQEQDRRAKDTAWETERRTTEAAWIADREAMELAAQTKVNDNRKIIARQQAEADKAMALFNIGLNALVALSKGDFLTAGLAAIQAIAVAATPLPKLAKGALVKASTGGSAVNVAEAGEDEAVLPVSRLEALIGDIQRKTVAAIAETPRPISLVADAGNMATRSAEDAALDRMESLLERYATNEAQRGATPEQGDIHLQVSIDSKPILDKIFPATRNRTILIDAGAVV